MDAGMDTTNPPPADLISRPAAGRLLGVGPQAVDGLIRRGELRAWRIGERVKLSEWEVEEYRSRSGYTPPGRSR